MDLTRYLARLGYEGSLAPTSETLRGLHLAHRLAVPFENLSIHSREPIVLDDEALFQQERELSNEREYVAALREHFGITLDREIQ